MRRFEKVFILAEDKALAKVNASIRGMKMCDYFSEKIHQDVKENNDKMNSMSQKFVNKKNKGGFHEFF